MEMMRSQRTLQQWAILDRSRLNELNQMGAREWAGGDDEEKAKDGVELSLGLGVAGNSQCRDLPLPDMDHPRLEIRKNNESLLHVLPFADACVEGKRGFDPNEEATSEQQRFLKREEDILRQQQLARRRRKMAMDEQKQQKRGKEEEKASSVPRLGRNPWPPSWPKDTEKLIPLSVERISDSDQLHDTAEQSEQPKTGIDPKGSSGNTHYRLHMAENGFKDLVLSQQAQLHPSDKIPASKQPLNYYTPNSASAPCQNSIDVIKEDDPSSFENKLFLLPASIPLLPYPYHSSFPSGSALPFPTTLPFPHPMQMLGSPNVDVQSHGGFLPFPPNACPFVFRPEPYSSYQVFQNQPLYIYPPASSQTSSSSKKVQANSSPDRRNNPSQAVINNKDKSRPPSPQSDPVPDPSCAAQSEPSSFGSNQHGSIGTGLTTAYTKWGDQPLRRDLSDKSAFTSVLAPVQENQGLAASKAAISNSSSKILHGTNGAKISDNNRPENPSEFCTTEAPDARIPQKEGQGLQGMSQGTTKDIPGIESLAKEPFNLKLGLAPDQTFGGMGYLPELPWVSTTKEGQNAKPVSGVVYKGYQGSMQIVCACHGKHMSPYEFVQHGGQPGMPMAGKGAA